ncbi:NAD-dependent epimerase/dehydratase family protein [Steroidobacter sp.]|uniref:NAD-dependent epimerase/dehydratase family protein n=1 Tax=Steroidobacter sp. TaxID=1978227 RepID=UPI001A4F3F03|nr:NAD-dependent epimerase/dehydratase family protein [Steroidobacter sp.]MBL8267333.1 NAD-dependent epimerase/dehydratase family protein [Steroidobacter sp.]
MDRRHFIAAASAASLAASAPGWAATKARQPLKIVLLGGTRFIGVHMTELALARGHTVTFFNRGKTKSDLFPQVEKLHGDRDAQLDALKGRKWDAVIDTSGYVPRHVRLSAELLAPNVAQYLFISTIGLYADFTKANDENSAVATVEDEKREDWQNAYGPLKALCEKAVNAAMPGRTTMVRPGLIVGPEDSTDRFTFWPARAAQGGEMIGPGDAAVPFQIIDARDLAAFCIDALENRTFGVFNVTSPTDKFNVGDVVKESIAAGIALAKPNPPPHATWVPVEFLTEQKVTPFADLPGWLPAGGEMGGLHRTKVDRALKAGLKISPLQRTARDTLAWHLARPEAEREKLKAGLTIERQREVLAAWHAKQKGA